MFWDVRRDRGQRDDEVKLELVGDKLQEVMYWRDDGEAGYQGEVH